MFRPFLLLCLITAMFAAETVPLVASYAMEPEGKDAQILADGGGGKRHGKLLDGAVFADGGHTGKALRLGGGTARAQLPQDPMFDALVGNFTVTMWVKPERRPDGDLTHLVTKRSQWWMAKPFAIEWLGDGTLQMSTHDGAWRNPRGGSLPAGEWHHLAISGKRGGRMALSLDGTEVIGQDMPRSLTRNGEPFVLGFEPAGNFQGGNYKPYIGLIDDVHFYATALDATQLRADMAGTLATRPATAADLPKRQLESVPPAEVTAAPAADAPLVCELVFERKPVARGMWYEQAATDLEEITADGKKVDAVVCKGGSAPAVAYARSLRLAITDPRFRDGRMPVVDVAVEYSHPFNSGVYLLADTARGPQTIANSWGGSDGLRIMRGELDDARFSSTDSGAPDGEVKPDGFDLRINGYSGDMRIRRVTVTGYDLAKDPDWKRLLKLQGIGAPAREVFAFATGEPIRLDWRFRNLATVPAETSWKWRIADRNGRELATGTSTGACTPGKELTITTQAASTGLPFGIYEATLSLSAKRVSGPVEVFTRTVTVALGSTASLGKAAPGEFLYGLDVVLGGCWGNPRYLEWARWMGVDIIRAGADMGEYDKAMPIFRREHLQVMPMPEARYDADAGRRAQMVTEAAEQAARVAKAHPDIIWWEIGNEPDLGFYSGPIEDYAVGMAAIAKVIRGANPKSMPMNGGLSFFGDEGTRRSRKLVEIADTTNLGVLAYHGHGPLLTPEREAWERMRAVTNEFGKGTMTLVETESGVAAGRSSQQEDIQARTVVAKMVYAQGHGMPLFMFFRLHFEDADSYGMLYDEQQPRPSVLAYRALVERTRGLRCAPALDLGDKGLHAYPFAAGTRRCLVLWLDRAETVSTSVSLGASAKVLRDLKASDLYGNQLPTPPLAGPVATINVTEQPLFFSWDGAADGFPVIAPPPLRLEGCEVASGTPGNLRFIVRNADSNVMKGEVRVKISSRVPVTPASFTLPVQAAAGAEATVQQVLTVGASPTTVAWPQVWTVFAGLPEAATDPTRYRDIPTAIEGTDAKAHAARLQDGRLELARLAGGFQERRGALCFAMIDSPTATTIEVGAGADWWMEWAVNGERVYSTMNGGNGSGFHVGDHRFPVKLKAGRNLLAVRVLSGSQGFVLACGGPEELRALDPKAADRVDAELVVGSVVVARSAQSLQLLLPLPTAPAGGRQALAATSPLAVLNEPEVDNLFMKHPDNSRWWHGEDDCSARIWATADASSLQVVVAVRDDAHRAAGPGAGMAERDCVQVGVQATGEAQPRVWTAAQVDGKPMASLVAKPGVADPAMRVTVERDEASHITWYTLNLDRRGMAAGPLRLNVRVVDDDAGYTKQYANWRGGLGATIDASLWRRFLLP